MATYPMNREEFEQEKATGLFNRRFTYEDYRQMIREQEELGRQAQEKADREGYELGAPQMELTPEDEAILDRVWAQLAAKKANANSKPEAALPTRVI